MPDTGAVLSVTVEPARKPQPDTARIYLPMNTSTLPVQPAQRYHHNTIACLPPLERPPERGQQNILAQRLPRDPARPKRDLAVFAHPSRSLRSPFPRLALPVGGGGPPIQSRSTASAPASMCPVPSPRTATLSGPINSAFDSPSPPWPPAPAEQSSCCPRAPPPTPAKPSPRCHRAPLPARTRASVGAGLSCENLQLSPNEHLCVSENRNHAFFLRLDFGAAVTPFPRFHVSTYYLLETPRPRRRPE